jgi:hypothetical protein
MVVGMASTIAVTVTVTIATTVSIAATGSSVAIATLGIGNVCETDRGATRWSDGKRQGNDGRSEH